jgi:hypothetical protein
MLHDLSHDQPQGSGADAAATGQRPARQEAIAQNPGFRHPQGLGRRSGPF